MVLRIKQIRDRRGDKRTVGETNLQVEMKAGIQRKEKKRRVKSVVT